MPGDYRYARGWLWLAGHRIIKLHLQHQGTPCLIDGFSQLMIRQPSPSNGSRIKSLIDTCTYPRAGLLSPIVLSLHAPLFSLLGTSVYPHPVPVPSPSVGEELQRLLEGQDIGGQTTWIRTVATFSVSRTLLFNSLANFLYVPQDAHSKDHCDDFITFNPPERPRIGLLLASPGEFHEGNHVEGDLEKVLETIKGTWILRPDVSGLSNLHNL